MENPPLVITLSADDIQPAEFISFIEATHQLTITTATRTQKKEGRSALGVFTDLIISDSMTGNLLSSVIYDVLKFGFKQISSRFFEAKPKAVIKLKSGKKIELPATMSDDTIQAELLDCIQKGVTSIHFDS
jgi:hypothetical protein